MVRRSVCAQSRLKYARYWARSVRRAVKRGIKAGAKGAETLLQDGLVDAPDAAVALGPTGADAGVAHARAVHGLGEGGAGELSGVVSAEAGEPPAVAGQVRGDLLG